MRMSRNRPAVQPPTADRFEAARPSRRTAALGRDVELVASKIGRSVRAGSNACVGVGHELAVAAMSGPTAFPDDRLLKTWLLTFEFARRMSAARSISRPLLPVNWAAGRIGEGQLHGKGA
jgi:hypothetical protein